MTVARWASGVLGAAIAGVVLASAAWAEVAVPAAGASPTIDAIRERGTLRVAAIGEFPWLPQNTSGSGPQYSGPAWVLAEEYATRLGVGIEVVEVSHETKVPILATKAVDISIAPLAVTDERKKVVDFVVYSVSSLCLFGLADNPKLAAVETVDDLDKPEITIAYFTGTPPENWLPTRLPEAERRGVAGSGANAPVEEILSGRADVTTIDNAAWPQLSAKVPGLVVFPKGDGCRTSQEMATPVGLAVDKGDPAFLDWLTAVYEETKDKVSAEEIRIMEGGA